MENPTEARQARRVKLGTACIGVVAVALSAACGGGSDGRGAPGGLPTLVGTVLPTATAVPPTAAVCAPPGVLALPANFPAELFVPPRFVVWAVQTTPYLHVEGRAAIAAAFDEPAHGVIAAAIVRRLAEQRWMLKLNTHVDGQDYDVVALDGRKAHFLVTPSLGCPGETTIVYDATWITP